MYISDLLVEFEVKFLDRLSPKNKEHFHRCFRWEAVKHEKTSESIEKVTLYYNPWGLTSYYDSFSI